MPNNRETVKKTGVNQAKAVRYGVIFTCMSTRTIHLEIADLTTSSFNLALCRFIPRQGNVKHILSDKGTNFKGAQKEHLIHLVAHGWEDPRKYL